jgi:hypothetical protein
MKTPKISKARKQTLINWLKANKKADYKEFIRETGGTSSQYYSLRSLVYGVMKPELSEAMKKSHERRRSPKPEQTIQVEEKPDVDAEQPEKENVLIEGVAPDFIWYEMDLLQRKLGEISSRIAHVSKVSQNRMADQQKMMRDLMRENTRLSVDNSSLRQQVTELTEMINGTSV